MATEVKVPELPESVAEATVGEWQINTGEAVERDANLVDLETDKVVLETPAPADGTLTEIKAASGDTVHTGDVLAVIEAGGAGDGTSETGADAAAGGGHGDSGSDSEQVQPAASSESTSQEAGDKAEQSTADRPSAAGEHGDVASPAARKILDEAGLSASDITGTGKEGRITKDDAQKAADGRSGSPQTEASAPAAKELSQTSNATDEQSTSSSVAGSEDADERREQRVPMTRIRQRISQRLLDASQNTAMLTTFNDLDMQAVMDIRGRYKDEFQKQNEIKLGFMSFFVTAAVEALKRFPVVNASIDADDIVYHGYYDIGLAVSSPRGLLVPVLRDADTLSFAEIESGVRDFGERAQSGKIGLDELTGGTFTITNGGIFGSYLSTPIINPPQAAILGMHATRERPVVVDGEIQIRPIMMLALSYDHRLIDGRDAVLFLRTIKEQLEDPARLLLQV